MAKWFDKLVKREKGKDKSSFLRGIIGGSLYKMSDIRGNTSLADIHTRIDTMRALANDSQISTALNYYATDATVQNSDGKIIWATSRDDKSSEVADIINALFDRWQVNKYARDHILELATIGNLYIPTTELYKQESKGRSQEKVAIDNNTLYNPEFDIVCCYKIPPESVVHLWNQGRPEGYILDPEDDFADTQYVRYPESAIIHFSLGGLLGDYTISAKTSSGESIEFDIQFAEPMLGQAVQPTQTLNLLEDALLLASMTRVVKFINVECGNAEDNEIRDILQQVKDAIEQQLSLNTSTGDAQSFVNPQSPNNLIYLPRVNQQDAISVTDLNMAESSESDNKLLDYYQNKKLSVLGIPKEAMNYNSAEGLGGAGAVMSQRSALYANCLQRLQNAYMQGWRDALNTYFEQKQLSGFVDNFDLHMSPILTEMSSVQFEKRDAALGQASTIIDILKALGVTDKDNYKGAVTELLSDVLPTTSADVKSWKVDVKATESEGGVM